MNFLYFFFLSLALTESIQASDTPTVKYQNESVLSKRVCEKLNITEIVLKNGMKVILKQTQEEPDELQIRLFAKGGYAGLPEGGCQLAHIAIETAWESGLGNISADQLSVFLYENSIEFFPKIEANYRALDASLPVEATENYLEFVKQYFTQKKFDRKEFDRACAAHCARESIELTNVSEDPQFSLDLFQEGNGPRIVKKITSGDYNAAKNIFEKSFLDPGEYVCVIVGDFSPQKMEKFLSKTLACIPPSQYIQGWEAPTPIDFPTKVTHRDIHAEGRNDNMIRITFPIARKLNAESMRVFKLACKVVEKRLNEMWRDDRNPILINVQDELPLYPSLDTAWMSVQFRCCCAHSDLIVQKVIAQIKRLHEEGPYVFEVEEQRKKERESQIAWANCNEYWLSTLTNCCLWGTDLDFLLEDPLCSSAAFENVKSFLQQTLLTDVYISLSVKP